MRGTPLEDTDVAAAKVLDQGLGMCENACPVATAETCSKISCQDPTLEVESICAKHKPACLNTGSVRQDTSKLVDGVLDTWIGVGCACPQHGRRIWIQDFGQDLTKARQAATCGM